jgi:hypothetical protein
MPVKIEVGEDGVERRVKPGAPTTDPDLSPAPGSATFETLKDGSTALVSVAHAFHVFFVLACVCSV